MAILLADQLEPLLELLSKYEISRLDKPDVPKVPQWRHNLKNQQPENSS